MRGRTLVVVLKLAQEPSPFRTTHLLPPRICDYRPFDGDIVIAEDVAHRDVVQITAQRGQCLSQRAEQIAPYRGALLAARLLAPGLLSSRLLAPRWLASSWLASG